MPEPLDEFDVIYRAFAENLGWHPRDVDRLEVWEAARLLGLPERSSDLPAIPAARLVRFNEDAAGGGPSVLEGGGSSMGDDLQARRVLAAKGEAPPPDWT